MRHSKRSRARLRDCRYEALEERLALSVQPLSDVGLSVETPWEQSYSESIPLDQFDVVDAIGDLRFDEGWEQPLVTYAGAPVSTLNAAHIQTGVDFVYNNYGLDGAGQTVVVIDSGIAWDHVALGGGLGKNYRVVGGYDFAENDTNPYDDAPAGFHGTHVAGIIGSSSATYRGVAPGVDLVGLRVFDDRGAGNFGWVEQALRWVHTNRGAFKNPITTVNLSLGTSWNSASVPNWSTIEDEFRQLKADGIFISVSAGNSFGTYKTPGLSYPAASPYVVPVASVDGNGMLSDFSQRSSRAIAAPGRSIVSTIPDYAANRDGVKNDFGGASGTSMAAPYVAGASALVRQAMQLLGRTNINEDTINAQLRSTADVIVDTLTKANYLRLNVQRAIESLMPKDDYGSTATTAFSLGSPGNGATFKGMIGTVSDVDCFKFTAASTGRLTFSFNTTHDLVLNTQVVGGTATFQGNKLSLDVTAGRVYTLSLNTKDGIGYYDATLKFDPPATNLGTVDYRWLENQNNGATTWYDLTASRTGILTVEALFAHAKGNVNLEVYNSSQQLVASSNSLTNNERVDLNVTQGQRLLVKVVGVNNDVDLRFTNLISQSGTTISVFGTANADQYALATGTKLTLTVNGAVYSFASTAAKSLTFNGGAGIDTVRVTGGTTGLNLNLNDVIRPLGAVALDGDVGLSEAAGEYAGCVHWGGVGLPENTDAVSRTDELDPTKVVWLDGSDVATRRVATEDGGTVSGNRISVSASLSPTGTLPHRVATSDARAAIADRLFAAALEGERGSAESIRTAAVVRSWADRAANLSQFSRFVGRTVTSPTAGTLAGLRDELRGCDRVFDELGSADDLASTYP